MPDSTTPPGAVFLSYSREDSDVARRLADALRAFGIEVWFDQNELRGGDAWDAKIRNQIRTCALFVPIVSAHSQARAEGYFRREWKIAAERTHDMAAGVPFLLPVVIDGTPESAALVPEEFMRVHWTRLARGVPTPQFVEQVERLLGHQPEIRTSKPAGSETTAREIRGTKRVPGWTWGLPVAVVIGIVVAMTSGRKSEPPPPAPAPVPVEADKSIAILPFANMSDEKDTGYFADGVHEDLLTSLANISAFKVISRTSVMQYRDTKKPIRQIGAELGVAYILEGSVRRAGNKVRVTGQLIDTRTEGHVWSANYDKDLNDVFAIQAALATEIAKALHAVLSPEEKAGLARTPTANPAAYELYLKARNILNTEGRDLDTLPRAQALLESAVELDPKFAAAWGDLAMVHRQINRRVYDPTGVRAAKSQAAAETMERLAPDEPETWVVLARHYLYLRNYSRSEYYLQRAAQVWPNNGEVVLLLTEMDKHHGRWSEALSHYRQAYALDPQNPVTRNALKSWLIALRRFDEATVLARLEPNSADPAMQSFLERGSTAEMEAWCAANPQKLESVVYWKLLSGQTADYVKLSDELRRQTPSGVLAITDESNYASALMALGDTNRAREAATRNLARLKADRVTDGSTVAENLALLGDKPGALEALAAEQARNLKEGVNTDYVVNAWLPAFVLAELGEKEKALAEFARLLQVPSGLNVHMIDRSWPCRNLRGDPAFKAMIADPRNNAPLL